MGKTIPKQLAWGRYQSNAILGLGDDTKTISSGWSHYFFINGRFEHLVLWSNKEHCLWKGHSGQTHWTLRGNTNWITYKLNVKYSLKSIVQKVHLPKHIKNLSEGFDAEQKVWNGYILELCFLCIWEVHLRFGKVTPYVKSFTFIFDYSDSKTDLPLVSILPEPAWGHSGQGPGKKLVFYIKLYLSRLLS